MSNFRIPTIYKPYILPVGVFVLMIVLAATLGKYAVDNILTTQNQIETLNKENTNLSAKIELLKSLDDQKLTAQTVASLDAVPESSSTLPALSSLRTIATKHQVDMPDFSVNTLGAAKNAKGKTVKITADLIGSKDNVLETIKEIRSSAPLMRIENVSIRNRNDNDVKADITILSIWSPLPQPSNKADSSVDTLKGNDEEVANKLIQLKKPEGAAIVPYPPQGKENPFSY